MNQQLELGLFRLEACLRRQLGHARDPLQALRHVLRQTRAFLDASEAIIAVLDRHRRDLGELYVVPETSSWDRDLLTRFLRLEYPQLPADTLLQPVRWRGRNWALIGFRDRSWTISTPERRTVVVVARLVSAMLERLDHERERSLRARIVERLVRELRPKDLLYEVLHALRTLTRYDHSSALLIVNEAVTQLRLVAEQIRWTKAKSRIIGLCLELAPAVIEEIRAGRGGIFVHERSHWRPIEPGMGTELARLLDYNAAAASVARGAREKAMLCAPILGRDGTLGVIKVATQGSQSLGPEELRLVNELRPLTALVIQRFKDVQR
ncbi:MAG: hypothetical protein JSV80_09790 [Acidobacteriota bacterium]|nr:MAG: hypothetical protein JSV80_09790 [Acidobacteriota bacterium]